MLGRTLTNPEREDVGMMARAFLEKLKAKSKHSRSAWFKQGIAKMIQKLQAKLFSLRFSEQVSFSWS